MSARSIDPVDPIDAIELRRLRWRCRRGMKELDVLFERYLDERFARAPSEERESFLNLLDHQDSEVWSFCMGDVHPGSSSMARFISRLTDAAPE